MDIYSFIRSKDVAAHCREIGKTWNTYEMAVIIGRSHRTIAEKHEAWCELIKSYPDMPTPENRFKSIHEEIEKLMDIQECELTLFMTPEIGAFYKHTIPSDDIARWSKYTYQCFEDALLAAKDSWKNVDVPEICVVKVFAKTDDNTPEITATANADRDGNILFLWFSGRQEDLAKMFPSATIDDMDDYICSDYTYIDIPTPFKRGDILIWRRYIFVLDSLDSDNPERLEENVERSSGYNYETGGLGYFVNDNGGLYGDHVDGNDTYRYYRGKLEGNNRLLHYVSLYFKGEIDIAALLCMQCRIILEHQLSSSFSLDLHGCYIPEHLHAEK